MLRGYHNHKPNHHKQEERLIRRPASPNRPCRTSTDITFRPLLLPTSKLGNKLLALAEQALVSLSLPLLFLRRARLLRRKFRNVGSAATAIVVRAFLLAVNRGFDVLACACELGTVGIVAGHVARAAAAGGVVFTFQDRGDEVGGGGFCAWDGLVDVAFALLAWNL